MAAHLTGNRDRANPPNFLSYDPFPGPRDGRPASSASGLTSASSEWDHTDVQSEKGRESSVPSMTGPVGEPGLPPSRPAGSSTTTASASQRTRAQSPLISSTSRRGMNGNRRGGEDRPGSAMSNTHVPSVVPQGFLKPMSSQQLQQQRNQRMAGPRGGQISNRTSVESDRRRILHRYSDASIRTTREHITIPETDIPPLPISPATVYSHENDAAATDGSHDTNVANSIVSKTSETPLREQKQVGASNSLAPISSQPEKSPRSSKSVRASLRLGSKRVKKTERVPNNSTENTNYQQASSEASSGGAAVKTPAEKFSQPLKPYEGKEAGKNYEYFAGNMLFFLSGRCMNARARPMNVTTGTLTALPAALFLGFEAPWLWHNLSPAVPIIFAYVFYLTFSSFLHATFSDPGILPRNIHPHPPNPAEDADPLTPGPPTTEWIVTKTFAKAAALDSDGLVRPAAQAMEVPTKYCNSCSIWRPPRTHHCRICDACVETQDHHCAWLNNCVGRRNYRYFFAYVSWGSVLALMLLAFSISHITLYGKKHNISFGKSLSGRNEERVAFAMFLYSLLALPYPGSLLMYHLFLIGRGETTREYLNSHKFAPRDRHRPWTQSTLAKNWLSVLYRPRPPSYLQFKRPYSPGDQRMGYMQRKSERDKNQPRSDGTYTIEKYATGGTELRDLRPGKVGTAQESGLGRGGVNMTPRL